METPSRSSVMVDANNILRVNVDGDIDDLYSVEAPVFIDDEQITIQSLTNPARPLLSDIHALFDPNHSNASVPPTVGLHLSPEEPLSHPIPGDIVSVTQLVLKVIEHEDGSQEYFLEGLITKTCRFRALADYQTLPDKESPVYLLRTFLRDFDLGAIESFSQIQDFSSMIPSIPPPTFTRTEYPHVDYLYHENPAIIRQEYVNEKGETKVRLVNRNKPGEMKTPGGTPNQTPMATPSRPLDSQTQTPVSQLSTMIPQSNKDVLILHIRGRLQALFNERPIWTRFALECFIIQEFKAPNIQIVKMLPDFAEKQSAGAWGSTWIKTGYTPNSPENAAQARMYQTISLRVHPQNRRLTRGNRGKRDSSMLKTPLTHSPAVASQTAPGTSQHFGHLFNGVDAPQSRMLQICDITDPELTPVILDESGWSDRYTERYGWFRKAAILAIRQNLKNKTLYLLHEIANYEIVRPDFTQNDNSDEGDEEEEQLAGDEAAQSDVETDDEDNDFIRTDKPITRQVRNQASQFMERLQQSQEYNELLGGDEQEFFDIYDDESDEYRED